MTVYLQYRLGDQVTRIALTKNSHPLRHVDERVISRATYIAAMEGKRKALQIVVDTEGLNKNGESVIEGDLLANDNENLGDLFNEERGLEPPLEGGH
jgi:hypothetical protein